MSLHDQIKQRRQALGLTQHDMQPRIGMSRQQYQRLEAGGNPRLDSLTLVAAGLNAELMLIPQDKLYAVQAVLDGQRGVTERPLDADPWQGLLDGPDSSSHGHDS
ncbi:helix-turn-helix transcriptional regulator [Chromohalobacter sarecensis]|uniref:Helix-turn-helix transcriptional regulator n=1 Tax=Chromohalobacter sarecensis TaxID=245294 RepID=A0ABV9CXB3_9GAMM|nr:helix-turn-helix transcriptional regulator [Chromohalobacter sarecensis]MCK0715662.1 helix-turn-helix domain-containing protein [Chromohalobacter sarecensis]